jgi:threonine/homoserine/homoserine lactone efflux protein
MYHLSTFLAFAVATLLLNLTPGPDMMYVLARSIGQGRRAGILSALGIAAGCLVHTLAASLGLAALLHSVPWTFRFIRWAGSAYLIFLGIRLLIRRASGDSVSTLPADSGAAIFRQGVLTNVFNPKVALFFLAFLPQFVDSTRGNIGLQMAFLGLYFVFSGTVVTLTVAALAGVAGNALRRTRVRATVERASGAVFVAMGVRVAFLRDI